jgi:cyanophycinase-like exopeptidase
MQIVIGLVLIVSFYNIVSAQNYTSYRTGNPTSTSTTPYGGICLMGGANENNEGMKWFLQQANGGDILILRTSGTDGYNDYFYNNLDVVINSVETIVFHNSDASNEAYIWSRINEAEAIWLAGGDQWEYISYWRNTPIDSLINKAIDERAIVVGGTSAGMAIQGQYYFSAQNGTITSLEALSNPFNPKLTISDLPFIQHAVLASTITDTHFDNPDRKGRLTSFLARMYIDYGIRGTAIACDEYTAVCIDANGIARVFGDYPTYDDQAYFIQTNCDIQDLQPETILSGSPLTWNKSGEALLAYNIKGNALGSNQFNINDWKTSSGGTWQKWSVINGTFQSATAVPPNCETLNIYAAKDDGYIYDLNEAIGIQFVHQFSGNITLQNSNGQVIEQKYVHNCMNTTFELHQFPSGMYFLKFESNQQTTVKKWIITR